MSSADDKRLIVGLGNPGTLYEKTRHNYGFMVLEAFARVCGWSWKRSWRVKGRVASGLVGERKVLLLLPQTYMNLSGGAVAHMMRVQGISPANLMIVVDDVAIPFGTMRMRPQGSSGGHQGLVSVEASLQTQAYARLRMGIGNEQLGRLPLEAFVLSRFQPDEEAKLPGLIEEGVTLLKDWLYTERT